MKSSWRALLILVFLMASPAWTASFIVPPDTAMIDNAKAIVIATATSSHSEPNELVGIVTVTDFAVERVLKGENYDPIEPLRLTELGGQLGDRYVLVPGSPRFAEGERVLLFLNRGPRGEWRTLNMILGKFNFRIDEHGNRLVVRELGEIGVVDERGKAFPDQRRLADKFIEFIQARQRGEIRPASYFIDGQTAVSDSLRIATMSRTDYLLTASNGLGFRWPNPNPTYLRSTGDPMGGDVPGLDEVGAIATAMGFWNGQGGSNVSMTLGGTTTSTKPTCAPPCSDDAFQNNIVFNDPHGIVDDTWTGSGTLGVGIVYGAFPPGHEVGGETFITIVECHVVMNDGITSGNTSPALFNHAIAHELGHTIGFRHSNEGTPFSNVAVMRSPITSIFGGPQAWDLDALGTVYGAGPPPPPPCTPPSITDHPDSQTITSGSSALLSVSATGTSPFTYQWRQGTPPGGTPFGPNSPSVSVSPTVTTSYYVNVSNSCGNQNSDVATVTVTPGPPPPDCVPPTITSQPQSQTIGSGQSASLFVGFTGTQPISVQWYRGLSGDTSNPVFGAVSQNFTPSPTQTTSYWAQVIGPCGSPVNSATATVTVTTTPPPCNSPVITQQPASTQITAGQSTTLTVVAGGTSPFSYQWRQGTPPGGTLVGTNSPSLTVSPTSTTSYWVRVSHSCSGAVADSSAATVTVGPPCDPGHICLFNGRFKLALFARDQRTGATGTGVPQPENDVFGFFSLASLTGDPRIPEVFVKMLDATSLPGANFWLFYSGLTDLEYSLVVTDTKKNQQKIYTKPAGSLCGDIDLGTFTLDFDDSTVATSTAISAESHGFEPQFTCGSKSLCLLATRFDVSLTARDPRSGNTAVGIPVPKNDLFGYFSLVDLTGDPRNPEVFVKMIDATGPFGKFWVFHGGLTDLEYTLRVKDNLRNITKTYLKPAGSFCGEADTAAFDP